MAAREGARVRALAGLLEMSEAELRKKLESDRNLVYLKRQVEMDVIARIEKLDEHTVKFTLNEVDAAFIQNLAMPFPSIQSAEYAAQLLKQADSNDMENRMLGVHFRMMNAWFSVSRQRGALEQMSQVVAHFANSLGEQAYSGAAA